MKRNEDIGYIHQLIERYFDATADLDEERELRALLAKVNASTPLIEEARAVIGFAAVERNLNRKKRTGRVTAVRWMSMAASVAVALAVGTVLMLRSQDRVVDRCIAYNGLNENTDVDMVMSLMGDQLQIIDDAAAMFEADVTGQLGAIAELSNQF